MPKTVITTIADHSRRVTCLAERMKSGMPNAKIKALA